MNKKFTRILSIVLVGLMVLSVISVLLYAVASSL